MRVYTHDDVLFYKINEFVPAHQLWSYSSVRYHLDLRYFELAFATKDLGLPNGEVCSKRLHCTREHVDRCRRTCALNQQFNFWFVQKDLDQCKRRVLGADFS